MAKAGHVYHWKHGWIPLDGVARAQIGKRGQHRADAAGTPPEVLKRAKARQAAFAAQQAAAAPRITTEHRRGNRWTKVAGCPDVNFKEIEELPARSPSDYAEVADAAQTVVAKYPRLLVDENGDRWPLTIGFTNELEEDVMADTGAWEFDKIRLNINMWDQPETTHSIVADMKKRHWGVFAQGEPGDLETFRRSVLTHEIGHVLQMRDEGANKHNGSFTLTTISKGDIDKFTDEPVTPRQAGWAASAAGLDTPVARWQVDDLGHRSNYAMTNKYEFWAEAFLDGTINGDKATPTGKRAVELANQVFGPKETA